MPGRSGLTLSLVEGTRTHAAPIKRCNYSDDPAIYIYHRRTSTTVTPDSRRSASQIHPAYRGSIEWSAARRSIALATVDASARAGNANENTVAKIAAAHDPVGSGLTSENELAPEYAVHARQPCADEGCPHHQWHQCGGVQTRRGREDQRDEDGARVARSLLAWGPGCDCEPAASSEHQKPGDTPDTACPSASDGAGHRVAMLRFCFLLPVLLCAVVVWRSTVDARRAASFHSPARVAAAKRRLGVAGGGRREKGTGQRMHAITYDLCWICSMSS
jgi:hypothetical protein